MLVNFMLIDGCSCFGCGMENGSFHLFLLFVWGFCYDKTRLWELNEVLILYSWISVLNLLIYKTTKNLNWSWLFNSMSMQKRAA